MARKLRWFQDQITKAGQNPVPRPVLDKDIELEDLEVTFLGASFSTKITVKRRMLLRAHKLEVQGVMELVMHDVL